MIDMQTRQSRGDVRREDAVKADGARGHFAYRGRIDICILTHHLPCVHRSIMRLGARVKRRSAAPIPVQRARFGEPIHRSIMRLGARQPSLCRRPAPDSPCASGIVAQYFISASTGCSSSPPALKALPPGPYRGTEGQNSRGASVHRRLAKTSPNRCSAL